MSHKSEYSLIDGRSINSNSGQNISNLHIRSTTTSSSNSKSSPNTSPLSNGSMSPNWSSQCDYSLETSSNTTTLPLLPTTATQTNKMGRSNSSRNVGNNSNYGLGKVIMKNYKCFRTLVAGAIVIMFVRILASNGSVTTFSHDPYPTDRQDGTTTTGSTTIIRLPPPRSQQRRDDEHGVTNYINLSPLNLNSRRKKEDGLLLVDPDDYVYKRNMDHYDAAPIVVPEYKLLFFSVPKVACTTFKLLFRRMKGISNWAKQDADLVLPHNPEHNGLRYLWDYPIEEANEMMTSPDWTRAIFVRDPKQRFLSAFLDKAISNDGWHVLKACCRSALDCKGGNESTRKNVYDLLEVCHEDRWDSRRNVLVPHWNVDVPCCDHVKQCREQTETVEGFLQTIESCYDEHWAPQYDRMEPKYWKYINFVGHMETINADTKRLLERIGAWETWGATGWGPYNNASILTESQYSQKHTTGATFKIYQWYTPEKERLVEKFYEVDYRSPAFQFTIQNLTENVKPPPDGELIKRADKIYSKKDWDGAPIVVEKYKLIFFTIPKVGATTWKQAFRRMEGCTDWNTIGGEKGLPHDPSGNGLKYLYDYDIETAESMMNSSEWTRAIFVRSPKDRFLSVYYHLSRDRDQIDQRCCPHHPGCSSTLRSMARFVDLMGTCYSTHWAPYSERMEEKYWPYINFVGTIENVEEDAKKLLLRLGAWRTIGASGWGPKGTERLFAKDDHAFDSVRDSLAMYTPQVDKMLDEFYQADYESKFFTFPTRKVWAMDLGMQST